MTTAEQERAAEEQAAEPVEAQQTTEPQPTTNGQAEPKATMARTNKRGLYLDSFEAFWRFASMVHESAACPTTRKDGQAIRLSIPDLVIALEAGAELGLPPMASIQSIAVINGRPCLWGDALLGVCMTSGLFDHSAHAEWFTGTEGKDDWTAHVSVRRFPQGTINEETFSVADAKKAGLWAKAGPWQNYPKRMLKYRARAFVCRDTFPDVLRGTHIAEEMPNYEQVLAGLDLDRTAANLEGANRVDALAEKLGSKAAPPNEPKMKPAPPAKKAAKPKPPAAPPTSLLPEQDDAERLQLLRMTIRSELLKRELPDQKRLLGNYGLNEVAGLETLDIENLDNLLGDLRHEAKSAPAG